MNERASAETIESFRWVIAELKGKPAAAVARAELMDRLEYLEEEHRILFGVPGGALPIGVINAR